MNNSSSHDNTSSQSSSSSSGFNTNDNVTISKELASIYINTFPHVGQKFLNSLMQQLTVQTNVQCTMLIQLLSTEEYKELITLFKNENIKYHVLSCDNNTCNNETSSPDVVPSSSSDDPSTETTTTTEATNVFQDRYLLVRSCYYNNTAETIEPNTIIPLSSLNSSYSPYIKALLNDNKLLSLEETEKESVYPPFHHFVSTRLESFKKKNDFIRGILCVMDNTTIDQARLNIIHSIFNTVHDRCINELNQIQQNEQLISARNLAVLDAENKLKFLADMSHEIRTPMNAVIALTDLLLQERSTLNVEQIEHLEVIQTSGSHLLTIINDILDISKLNHDPKFKLESRRFSLRKCLKDTLNMARHQASMSQQNKVVYVLECPPDKDDNLPLPQLISQLENNGILLRPLLHKKGKTVLPVIWKIDSDVPDHLLGDTMRLTQIMLNLCSNAVKFTKQGGIHIRIKRSTPTPIRTPSHNNERRMTFKERYDAKIETMWNRALQERRERNNSTASNNNPLSPTSTASSSAASGLVTSEELTAEDYFGEKAILEISVTDTGIGIPADRLPKLFKSFSQIDISTARRYGGTGLGLAISSTLVNRMGGCVWVESEEGVGSRFALTLPMTVAPRGRNYSNDSTPMGGISGSPSSPGSTISDSSSSVHSNVGTASDLYTFTSPAVNNAPNNPSYFPLVSPYNQQQQQQQQQQHQQQQLSPIPQPQQPSQHQQPRPILPRTTHQQLFATESYNRPEVVTNNPITQIIQHNNNNNNELPYSPMAEDLFNPTISTSTGLNSNPADNIKRAAPNSATSNNNGNVSTRKSYNDLLSPATRNTRIGITKQHYNRKPQSKEENLAKLHPLRILLAEDNILNQKIAISILKRLGYVDVAIANNGKEVLSLMKTAVFDVIFMDLYMPEMDGLEVTREIIKERSKQKAGETTTTTTMDDHTIPDSTVLLNSIDVYIIALTASASREDRQICIDAGMNDFISKPFTMTEMKAALKTCANKRKKRRKLAQKPTAEMEQESPIIQGNNNTTDDPMLDVETASIL